MNSPLESLLSLKRWEEDEAKEFFVLARKELEREESCLEGLEQRFIAMRKEMKGNEKRAMTIDEMRQQQQHSEHLVALLHIQKGIVAASIRRLDEAASIMAAVSIERKIYEKVDDRHKAAEKYQVHRKEGRDMDEHAVTRYKKNADR
jgi:flagellar export protein FliJ